MAALRVAVGRAERDRVEAEARERERLLVQAARQQAVIAVRLGSCLCGPASCAAVSVASVSQGWGGVSVASGGRAPACRAPCLCACLPVCSRLRAFMHARTRLHECKARAHTHCMGTRRGHMPGAPYTRSILAEYSMRGSRGHLEIILNA